MSTPEEAFKAFLASIGTMPVDKKMKLYIKAREASAAATRAYEEQKAQFKSIMDTAQNFMLADADRQGTTGFKTDAGTSFVAETAKITVADSGAFTTFLDALPPDADRYGFFEQRVSSRRVEDFIKATGTPPPGLNIFRERVMRVRKTGDKE